ncbi:MAG: hypothetical protein WC100_20690 [Sterolibacterium sp.]
MQDIFFAADVESVAFVHGNHCLNITMSQAGQIEAWIREFVQPLTGEKVEFLAATPGDWANWEAMCRLDNELLNETVRRATVAADDWRVRRRIEIFLERHRGSNCAARARALAWAVTDQP